MVRRSEQRESFVVRIWRKPGQPEWKGWVQHVRSGESAFLDDVDDLSTFVRRWTAEPAGRQQQGLR
jgi:hypothetical protein